MRKGLRLTVVALFTLSLSAACSRSSENSVTAPPNFTRTLSGQIVTVGDLAGSTPSGINVSSNGQVAVTDAAGRFTFTSLPDKSVQMAFTRSDGISASAMVNAGASAVVVELQKQHASVRTTGQSKQEIEGLIEEVSDDSITVNDARTHGTVTAAITPDTVIRKGQTHLTPDDLDDGDRVHVKASVNADGTLTAFEIILQNEADDDEGDDNGGDQGQVKELEGLIEEVSDTSITVNNASTHRQETAAITGDTVIRQGGTDLEASDLEKGDRVHVRTTGERDALVAVEIILQKPA